MTTVVMGYRHSEDLSYDDLEVEIYTGEEPPTVAEITVAMIYGDAKLLELIAARIADGDDFNMVPMMKFFEVR